MPLVGYFMQRVHVVSGRLWEYVYICHCCGGFIWRGACKRCLFMQQVLRETEVLTKTVWLLLAVSSINVTNEN